MTSEQKICRTCGGPIYDGRLFPSRERPTWLHARDADWVNNEHAAEPTPSEVKK